MTNAPAGWYPDSEQPGNERWWDGYQWSEHRRPSGDPLASGAAAPAVPFAHAPVAAKPLWKRTWFIVVAAAVALIVVGSVSSAIAGGNKGVLEPAAAVVTAVPSPTATPAQTSPSPEPT